MSNADELKHEYQITDEEIVESVLNPTKNNFSVDDEDDDELDNSEKINFDKDLQLGVQYLTFLKQQSCVTEQELIIV